MATSRASFSLRRLLLGPPLPTVAMPHQTVGKFVGLAVFSSDALSSVAYATEEILVVLSVAGAAYFGLSIPIALAICGLLAILTASYRQTIFAYPSGGGAYIVARDNLGELAAQTAGAALMIDYILTVSVSVASGVAQIVSAFPRLAPIRVELALAMIAGMALVNLRGVRESGAVFAIPTYFFIVTMLGTIAFGLYRLLTGHLRTVADVPPVPATTGQALTLFLILRAFSSGSTALTGVEAISNGIQAFREPKSRNAAATMVWMSVLLATLFLGITVLAHHIRAVPAEDETVISQIARTVWGRGPLYLTTLTATTVILIMAANTSFADFPRLAALHAADGFLPRQFTIRGSRLVFSWGIVVLASVASLLVVIFRASVTHFIPLYAIGVYLSFTLSRAGMVVRWLKIGRLRPDEVVETKGSVLRYDPHWRWKLAINAVGAASTFVVMIVFAVTKFTSGAWIVTVLVPLLVWIFFRIHHHYEDVRRTLSLRDKPVRTEPAPVIHMVLVSDVNTASLEQIRFVRSLGVPWFGVHVAVDEAKAEVVRSRWERYVPDGTLIVLPSPFRDLVGPIREYVEALRARHPEAFIHVVMGQIVAEHFLEQALHQNATVIFALALRHIPGVAVTNVVFPLHAPQQAPAPHPAAAVASADE
jgi:amino acid transporter